MDHLALESDRKAGTQYPVVKLTSLNKLELPFNYGKRAFVAAGSTSRLRQLAKYKLGKKTLNKSSNLHLKPTI